jgi:RNA polymerase sigma-70 factor (ECF subfamily)
MSLVVLGSGPLHARTLKAPALSEAAANVQADLQTGRSVVIATGLQICARLRRPVILQQKTEIEHCLETKCLIAIRCAQHRFHVSSLGSVPLGRSPRDDCGSGVAQADTTQITADAAFRKYARYVAATAYRVLGKRDEVDDVVQEVFLAALVGLTRLRDEKSIRAWLTVVTIRAAIRRRKHRGNEFALSLEDEACENLSSEAADSDLRLLLASIESELNRLPSDVRRPWILHCIDGLELGQVATLCGCSVATVRRRVAVVRAHLALG